MRNLCQFFLSAVICLVVFAGCGLPAMPLREPIAFDYTPQTEAAPGSANVTFVVVGAKLAKPAQVNPAHALFSVQVPLFDDFANTVTNDFIEVLNARGYGVTGPYKMYGDIIHPVKEGSDLLLTAEVNIIAETKNIQIGKAYPRNRWALVGSVSVICDVKLVLSECLTNEPMWTKNVTLDPFTVQMDSLYPFYTGAGLASLAAQYGKISVEGLNSISQDTYNTRVFPNCPIGVFLERDNKLHSDLGRALKTQYKEALGVVYTYLDPREMAIVKNQAAELRKRKVY
ncbi:MAG: hypothetical protein OXU23_12465 [Candidatus Poribacteria bacterium]|nr:hypothetical protein [Candidatus Poribacteria bacterium]